MTDLEIVIVIAAILIPLAFIAESIKTSIRIAQRPPVGAMSRLEIAHADQMIPIREALRPSAQELADQIMRMLDTTGDPPWLDEN